MNAERAFPSRFVAFACAVLSLLFAAAVARHAVSLSQFFGDDLYSFWQARGTPLGRFMLTPIDVHPVPLHRLTSALLGLGRPRFGVAVGVLVTAHVLTLVLLHRFLESLGPSPVNALVVAAYGTSVHLPGLFTWWTSALHRVPFLLALSLALLGYGRFRERRTMGTALGVVLACVIGAGFFEKGVLIPFVLVAMELALWARTSAATRRAVLPLLGFLLVLTCAYFPFWRQVVGPRWGALRLGPAYLYNTARVGWAMLFRSSVGGVYGGAAFGLALFAVQIFFTVRRARPALIAWVVGFVAVTVSILSVGLSAERSKMLGSEIGWISYRYYPDVLFLFLVFVAIAWSEAFREEPRASSTDRLGRRSTAVVGLVFSLLVVGAVRNLGTAATLAQYSGTIPAKAYVDHVLVDLEKLEASGTRLVFVDGQVSPFVLIPGNLGRAEILLRALDARVTMVRKPGPGVFRIAANGAIEPTRPR